MKCLILSKRNYCLSQEIVQINFIFMFNVDGLFANQIHLSKKQKGTLSK